MSLTSLETIRTYIGDLSRLEQEEAVGDDVRVSFKLSNAPVIEDSDKVYAGSTLQTRDEAYTIDLDSGLVTFIIAPAEGIKVTIVYQWTLLSDGFVTDRLSSAGEEVIAAAITCLLAMASNYALLAKSVALGGYTKSETQIAGELRAQADRLKEEDLGGEAYSNIAWNSFGDRNI